MERRPTESMKRLAWDYAKSAHLTPSGPLSEVPSRVVLDSLHQRQFTGRLLLTHREKRKKIWFHRGEIFKVQSNLSPELFGQMMLEKNWLSDEDLRKCLQAQKELGSETPLGEIVKEVFGVEQSDLDRLEFQQKVKTLLQAMTWDEGEYAFASMSLEPASQNTISFEEILGSLKALLASDRRATNISKALLSWEPKSGTLNLAEVPVWSILASCRHHFTSGLLSIRKQSKLFEVVIKHGVPLTLYEGTFAQPRQTIVVRDASDEHERFFIHQIFKLFSFLTGTAHFRHHGDHEQARAEEIERLKKAEDVEGTGVVREGLEMTTHYNPGAKSSSGLFDKLKLAFEKIYSKI